MMPERAGLDMALAPYDLVPVIWRLMQQLLSTGGDICRHVLRLKRVFSTDFPLSRRFMRGIMRLSNTRTGK